jgi:GTPase SAR1 family protein
MFVFDSIQGHPIKEFYNEILTHIKILWNDPGIQVTYENRSRFHNYQLVDSDGYFLNKLSEIMKSNYIPSEDDVIRCRIRTTGILEYSFSIDSQLFKLLDVAGQRSERKKWIPYFSNATGVIFVAAISEYDQVLNEDMKTNRLLESIYLFTEIINNPYFINTPIVLFLNKCDLFFEKLKKIPLNVCFPKYRGEQNYEVNKIYIRR